jgi:hypothetical protein
MDVPDRCVRQRLADVRTAALVALMRPRGPMIDDLAAGLAVDPAATELGIERVQLVRAKRAGLLAADERPDVLVEVALTSIISR